MILRINYFNPNPNKNNIILSDNLCFTSLPEKDIIIKLSDELFEHKIDWELEVLKNNEEN